MSSPTEIDGFEPGNTRFYVYLHKTPIGRVFYVGKGTGRRAYDLSPSRRSNYHRNIIAKHGRENIQIQVIPCSHEFEAHFLERVLIKIHRENGCLANFTDGGEGTAGHSLTEKQREALAKGRMKGKRGHKLWQKQRENLASIARSPENRERVRLIGLSHKGNIPQRDHKFICKQCGATAVAASRRAVFCDSNCCQRYHRAQIGH